MSGLPKGWTTVALGEVVHGAGAKAGDADGFPVYSVTKYDGFVPSDEYFKKQVYSRDLSTYKRVRAGDFAYATIHLDEGSIGIAPTDALISPMYTAFSVDHARVHSAYLLHYLKSPRAMAQYETLGSGSVHRRRSISLKRLSSLPVPLPPLNEQRRIATILDNIAELIALRYESSNRVDRSVEMAFRAHFSGSNMQPLGEAAQLFGGGTLPTGEAFRGQADGNLLVKVSDMNRPGNERVIKTTASWTASSGPKSSTAPAHSVILPKRGGAINTNKKRLLNRPGILDPNLMGVSPDSSTLLPEVLYAWFQTFDLSSVTSGSTVPQLNKKDLIGLKVPATSIGHQTEFARLNRHADAIRHRLQDSLTGLLGLQNSLESRAFQGNL